MLKVKIRAPPLFPLPFDPIDILTFRTPEPKSSPTNGFLRISFFHDSKSSISEWYFFESLLN